MDESHSVMESSSKVELERALKQYERHLIGLFALVVLQPDFQRAQSEDIKDHIKRKNKHISALTCWAADSGIEDLADSTETILFILELAEIASNDNKRVILT